jgi:CheY-like chemotaxis protein
LANLLNNAAKYTPESGQITISAQRDGNEAVVRVCDTGEGIASDVLPHIFDLFTQAHRSLDRSQGGLGIGLTLVRTLVQMHGGTVEVFSAGPGRGCEFVVRLPALASAFPLAEVPQGLAGNELSAGLQIFVVDDNIDNADSLAFLLEDSGHRVHLAHDGPTALELAKLHQPQMILLDLGLPELDGFEVARRLREMPNTSKSFLVAVTGYGQDKHRQQTKDAGFDYHMVKPIEWSELLEIIRAIESSGRIEARSA